MGDVHTARAFYRDLCYDSDGQMRNMAVSAEALRQFGLSGIEASPEIVPSLAASLQTVCARLRLPATCVRLFVFPNSELQAQCAFLDREKCAVRVSSSMVERFADEEIRYVIGHELGHFLFGHCPDDDGWSLQGARASRAREISCDRIGLLACTDLNWALRSIMKVASGLTDEFMRFDAASFLADALRGQAENDDAALAYASHPPLAVRARALFWFDEYRADHFPDRGKNSHTALKKLDERVARDMEKYVEGGVKKLVDDAKLELKKWVWTATAISKQRFDAGSQRIIAKEFGRDFCDKLKDMLRSLNSETAFEWVHDNFVSAFNSLQSMLPRHASSEVEAALQKSEAALLKPTHTSFLRSRSWTTKSQVKRTSD